MNRIAVVIRMLVACVTGLALVPLVPAMSNAAPDVWSGAWNYSHSGSGVMTFERQSGKHFLGFYQSTSGGNDGMIEGTTQDRGTTLCGTFRDDAGPNTFGRGKYCIVLDDGETFSGWYKVCGRFTCIGSRKHRWHGTKQ